MNYAPTPRWALGMRQMDSGVYLDGNRVLHLDAPGFCVAHGYPPTSDNQEAAIRGLRRGIGADIARIQDHVEPEVA